MNKDLFKASHQYRKHSCKQEVFWFETHSSLSKLICWTHLIRQDFEKKLDCEVVQVTVVKWLIEGIRNIGIYEELRMNWDLLRFTKIYHLLYFTIRINNSFRIGTFQAEFAWILPCWMKVTVTKLRGSGTNNHHHRHHHRGTFILRLDR